MLTTILTRADVARNLEALTLLEELRAALVKGDAPPAEADGALVRHAVHPAIPASAVIVRAAGQSMLHLHQRPGGKLLAVMDAEPLIHLRIALVAALAADALASPDAKRVALLGGGPLASGALKALRLVRSLREVWLVMADPEQRVTQAGQLQQTLKTPVRPADHPAEAIASADIVVLAEGIPLPEVALWPSVHLSVLSAEVFAQPPLTPGVLAKAWRVSDSTRDVWGQPVHAQLGAVLAGTAARPSGANTLFVGSGPPWLDLLAAWHVYQGAVGDETLTRLDFGA